MYRPFPGVVGCRASCCLGVGSNDAHPPQSNTRARKETDFQQINCSRIFDPYLPIPTGSNTPPRGTRQNAPKKADSLTKMCGAGHGKNTKRTPRKASTRDAERGDPRKKRPGNEYSPLKSIDWDCGSKWDGREEEWGRMGQEACAYRWPGDGGGKQGWRSPLHNRRRIFCHILVNEVFLLKVTTSPACTRKAVCAADFTSQPPPTASAVGFDRPAGGRKPPGPLPPEIASNISTWSNFMPSGAMTVRRPMIRRALSTKRPCQWQGVPPAFGQG